MDVFGYTESGSIRIEIDGISMTVPDDPANRHRQMIAEWEAAGNTIPAYEPPAPVLPPLTARRAAVDVERDRRVDAGFSFAGTHFQSRAADRENIAGASVAALAAMSAGAQPGDLRWHGGDTDFVWIAEDNSLVPMDAQTMFAFGQAAMAHKQAMIFAARSIKDADPVPADYTDDSYWPYPIT